MNNGISTNNTASVVKKTEDARLPTFRAGEIQLESHEVAEFFPASLGNILQVPEHAIRFFGTLNIEREEIGLIRATYFLAPYVMRSALPIELSKLALWNTDDDRIRGTAQTYHGEVTKKYPELNDSVPLVILGIRSNWFQDEMCPFKVMELQRYADHRKLRGRGLATSILQSVAEQLRSKGTEFLYVNFPVERWPKSSSVIHTKFASPEMRQRIDNSFVPASGYTSFSKDFSWSGFFVMTDPQQHNIEVEKAAQAQE